MSSVESEERYVKACGQWSIDKVMVQERCLRVENGDEGCRAWGTLEKKAGQRRVVRRNGYGVVELECRRMRVERSGMMIASSVSRGEFLKIASRL
jgi:hypothetical protein